MEWGRGKVDSYTGVVNQEIKSRLLSHERFGAIFHALKALKIHHERDKVEWFSARQSHLLYGTVEPLGRATNNIYPGAMESQLECRFVSDPCIACVHPSLALLVGDSVGRGWRTSSDKGDIAT